MEKFPLPEDVLHPQTAENAVSAKGEILSENSIALRYWCPTQI